jgi:predicted trehalose synthase
MRIHGDLGLDRVVHGRHGWTVRDFTPDPTVPSGEQRQPSSPMRDVAALLHSLHVAAVGALAEHQAGVDNAESALLVEAWEERAAKAFVSGYTSIDVVHQLLPAGRRARDALLAVFELNATIEQFGRRTTGVTNGDADGTIIQLRADHHPHRW